MKPSPSAPTRPSLPLFDEGPVVPDGSKWDRLLARCDELAADGVLVAVSGGVDSALLLVGFAAAVERSGRGRVEAMIARGPSLPERDLADARSTAAALGVPLHEVHGGEMDVPEYRRNGPDRCFHCKTDLFKLAAALAPSIGCAHIAYGYTASDTTDHRPGHDAARRAGAVWPLGEVGLTKREVRWLLESRGFAISTKPASPCLASRIEEGMEVTGNRLAHVAAIEDALRSAGVDGARARLSGGALGEFVRIECHAAQMPAVVRAASELHALARRLGYRTAVLDLGGYSRGGATSRPSASSEPPQR